MNKKMPGSTEDRHLFIVRVWREDSQVTPGGQWRGSVEHVPSGQRAHFVSLDTLSEFVRMYLNSGPAEAPPARRNVYPE